MVAHAARRQLNRTFFHPLSPFGPEFGLARRVQPSRPARRTILRRGQGEGGEEIMPEVLVSRDGFGRPVPLQPAHSPHSG